jgi:hypothetical protein
MKYWRIIGPIGPSDDQRWRALTVNARGEVDGPWITKREDGHPVLSDAERDGRLSKLPEWTPNTAEDDDTIMKALDDLCLVDDAVREQWGQELALATESGWFCPTSQEEMRAALAALRSGKRVPSFPRTG